MIDPSRNRYFAARAVIEMAFDKAGPEKVESVRQHTELDPLEYFALQQGRALLQAIGKITFEESTAMYAVLNDWATASTLDRYATMQFLTLAHKLRLEGRL